MIDRNTYPNQLAFLEPCVICLRLTIGPNSGVVGVWGVETHQHCLTAARRWYPEAVAYVEAARAEAERAQAASLREAATP